MTAEQWHELGTELADVGRVIPRVARIAKDAGAPAVDVGQILLAVVLLVHSRDAVTLGRLAEHAVRLAP